MSEPPAPAVPSPGGLASDALTRAFSFLDISDVPSVARVSKEWHAVLRTTAAQRPEAIHGKDERRGCDVGLWLSLIRKYHPSVEVITRALPDDIDDGNSSANAEPTPRPAKRSRLAAAALGIPSPSKYWKQQFQRARMLQRSRRSVKPPKLDPKPLSAYWFQVDVTLTNSKNLLQNNAARTKVVSRLLDGKDVSFNSRNFDTTIDLLCRGGDEMANFPFDSFGIGITVVDKGTGRQATLYEHEQGADIVYGGPPDFDSWDFPEHKIFDYAAGILDELDSDERYPVGLGSALEVKKGGCDRGRYDRTAADRYGKGLFDQPPPHNKSITCLCEKEWQCYWDLKFVVGLYEFFGDSGDNGGSFAPLEQLRFLENLDFV